MAQSKIDGVNDTDPVARAAGLRPLLAKNAAAAEQERRISAENIDALQSAGLFNVMTPRRWGGYGAPIGTALSMFAELGRSCGSTAWVTTILNVATWTASLLPEQGQADIFAGSNQGPVCGVLTPTATSDRVKGGLSVTGRWMFASACFHATWAGVGVPVLDESGKMFDMAVAYIPMADMEIEDTWFVAGMRGTGSNTLVCKNVFVPDHRILSAGRSTAGDYPERQNATEPSDQYAFVPVLAIVLIGPILGMAQAVLDSTVESAHKRGITYTVYQRQTESSVVHHHIGAAALKIDSARMHMIRAAKDIHETALAGRKMDYVTRARVRGDSGHATRMLREAIDELVTIGGAAAFAENSPIQRFWRDANVAARHAVITSEPNFELYGRALLGVSGNITEMI